MTAVTSVASRLVVPDQLTLVSSLTASPAVKPWPFRRSRSCRIGTTVSIPKDAWHEVTRIGGARLLMIFTPGGSDRYISGLAVLRETDIQEEIVVKALSHKRDL